MVYFALKLSRLLPNINVQKIDSKNKANKFQKLSKKEISGVALKNATLFLIYDLFTLSCKKG